MLTGDAFKPPEELIKVFEKFGIENPSEEELVITCQRGVSSCVVDAALKTIGNKHTKVYDGSYMEYSGIIKI